MPHLRRLLALLAVSVIGTAALVPVASAHKAPRRTIVATAVAAGQFKTLVTLVKDAGLATALEGKGPFTVFAPTDAAFAKVPKATLTMLAHNRAKLRAVLLYHVLRGRYTAVRIVKLRSIKTLNGTSLRIRVSHATVTVGGATVVAANIRASNGIIHVINRVLIPR